MTRKEEVELELDELVEKAIKEGWPVMERVIIVGSRHGAVETTIIEYVPKIRKL